MGAAAKTLPSPEQCEKSWEHPPEMGGWHISHNAIKYDMNTIAAAVMALQKTLEAGRPLAAWQVDAVKNFWTQFGVNVVDHHMHEEEYIFPWLATRMVAIEKVSADHKTILQLESGVDMLMARLSVDKTIEESKALLADIASKFALFQREMVAHLDEEETEVVPAMRRTFTQQEEQKVILDMVKHMKKFDGVSTMWHLPPDERKACMNMAGIPKFAQWFIFNPRTKQYDRLFQQPVKRVIDGTPPPPPERKLYFWWGTPSH